MQCASATRLAAHAAYKTPWQQAVASYTDAWPVAQAAVAPRRHNQPSCFLYSKSSLCIQPTSQAARWSSPQLFMQVAHNAAAASLQQDSLATLTGGLRGLGPCTSPLL